MAPTRQYANHPDPMDLWLETQGYYRKSTARESSCLFRAISEQIYYTQKFHMELRMRCVEYMKDHLELFDGHQIEVDVDTYLEHLQCPAQWGSTLEIIAMAHLYKLDILIFKDVGVPAANAADTSYGKKVMLCFSHDRHYDSVYRKEFTKDAGFCQSLVYEVLYKNVFKMKDVDYAVDKMLHNKPTRHRGEMGGPRKFFSYSCNSIQLERKGIVVDSLLDDVEVNLRDLLMKGVTPFPYKVAKSLDPTIYRNVEFDVWVDYRRGLRQGYFGTNGELRVGVKCLVKIDDSTCVAHIQEMAPNKGPVIVFVEELGEKRTVAFDSLELLPLETPILKQVAVNPTGNRNLLSTLQFKSDSKNRKGDSKGKNNCSGNAPRLSSMGRRRLNSRAEDRNSSTDNCDSLNQTSGSYQDANMLNNFSSFTIDGYSSTGGYHHSYQMKNLEMGMTMPLQTHVLMQSPQHGNTQILIPVSPRPEDVPPHWLTPSDTLNSSEINASPSGGGYHFVPYNASGGDSNPSDLPLAKDEAGRGVKDTTGQALLDDNGNYVSNMNSQGEQINFNAPKSILDDGADLPISDIQTLRFFYNLGNDVYHSQFNMYGWGTYSQPCTVTSPSSPNPPGMCTGKCLCGPVCITTVPTIHHLLEPTTPPTNGRRKRKDSVTAGGTPSAANETDTPNPTGSQSSASTPLSTVPPRFKAKGRNKRDAKNYEGQPFVLQPTLQIHSSEDTINAESQNSSVTVNSDHASPTLSIPYSPSYGYLYYPTSPVVPNSPVETDPYFTPLRLQFPSDYLPDTPQSPQCYSLSGDINVYGSSSQYPMIATSPHYLLPASPGIYMGSPPAWSPVAPTTPQ